MPKIQREPCFSTFAADCIQYSEMGVSGPQTRQTFLCKKTKKEIYIPSREVRQPRKAAVAQGFQKVQRGGGSIQRGMGIKAGNSFSQVFFGIAISPRIEVDP